MGIKLILYKSNTNSNSNLPKEFYLTERTFTVERVIMNNVSDIAALRKWNNIPEDIRKKLLQNVLCGNCGVTAIAPGYTMTYKKGLGILLNGSCAKCGHDVSRVIEV